MRRAKEKDLFLKICDYNNLYQAYLNARKGKRNYKEVKMIDKDPQKYLLKIQEMLLNGTFHTSPYIKFYKQEGDKLRKIFKLPFYPDRIVQWAIIQIIQPHIINKFIKNTYSSIPNRGIHAGLNDIKRALKDEVGTEYCLKLDIKHYYQSIDHNILKSIYREIFSEEKLLDLIFEIIDSIDTCDEEDIYFIYGELATVIHECIDGYEVGIPIGNFLSQYSANLYLTEFDHWIKEDKKIKYYFRYMDDIVILSDSKGELHKLRKEIEVYLYNNLRLRLKRNYQVFKVSRRGVDFLGYRNFHRYSILRKSTCRRMKIKLKKIYKKVRRGKEINFSDYCCIGSYIGWLKHCNSHRLYQKYVKPLLIYCKAYHDKYLVNKEVV